MDNKIYTFAELEKQERPKAQKVLESLKDYAECGAAICPRVVSEVIDRAHLNASQLALAKTYARRGYNTQDRRRETRAAEEYLRLIRTIDDKLI